MRRIQALEKRVTEKNEVTCFSILTESISLGADNISAASGFHSPTMQVFKSGRISATRASAFALLGTSQVFFILRCKWLSPAG